MVSKSTNQVEKAGQHKQRGSSGAQESEQSEIQSVVEIVEIAATPPAAAIKGHRGELGFEQFATRERW